jgi:Ca2+-transporting ATPase
LAAILALVLANRSFSTSLSHALARHNIMFRYVLALVLGAAALILSVAPIRHTLGFAPLGAPELGLAALSGVVLLVACEWTKRIAPASSRIFRCPRRSSMQ